MISELCWFFNTSSWVLRRFRSTATCRIATFHQRQRQCSQLFVGCMRIVVGVVTNTWFPYAIDIYYTTCIYTYIWCVCRLPTPDLASCCTNSHTYEYIHICCWYFVFRACLLASHLSNTLTYLSVCQRTPVGQLVADSCLLLLLFRRCP